MNPILDSQFMEFMHRLMPIIDLEAWTHFNQEQEIIFELYNDNY